MIAEGSGDEHATTIQMEQRTWRPERAPTGLSTYGTLNCGLETMRAAWPSLQHRFSYGCSSSRRDPKSFPGGRPPADLLRSQPVDLLIMDHGTTLTASPRTGQADATLVRLIRRVPNRGPSVVLESWPIKSLGWEQSPTCKLARTQWQELGYASRYLTMDTKACGGAIDQVRLLVARVSHQWAGEWVWPSLQPPSVPRPMGNLLTPWGLLPRRVKMEIPPSLRAFPPRSDTDPMPNCVGAWISTPHGSAVCKPRKWAEASGFRRKCSPIRAAPPRRTYNARPAFSCGRP